MALDLQPPDGRKRVKVYELRDNDWFDRGTGFCTGTVMGVSSFPFVSACAAFVATATTRARAVSSVFPPRHRQPVANPRHAHHRRNREYTSNRKTNPSASYSRPRSPRTRAIKNSKVSVPPLPPDRGTGEEEWLD